MSSRSRCERSALRVRVIPRDVVADVGSELQRVGKSSFCAVAVAIELCS